MQQPITDTDLITQVSRLPRGSEIRYIAERIIGEEEDTNLAALFTEIASTNFWRTRYRAVAARLLGYAKLKPHERDAAIDVLRREACTSAKHPIAGTISALLVAFIVVFNISAIGKIIAAVVHFAINATRMDLFSAVSALSGLAPLLINLLLIVVPVKLLLRFLNGNAEVRAAAIGSLGQLRAPLTVKELFAAYNDTDQKIKTASATALHNVLPELTTDHFGLVDQTTLDFMVKAIEDPDSLLAHKILGAIEAVGTPGLIPQIERIAKHPRTPGLRDAANQALAALRKREELERMAKTLLRPATAPGDDTLLRPASGPAHTADELLLRPSSAEQVET